MSSGSRNRASRYDSDRKRGFTREMPDNFGKPSAHKPSSQQSVDTQLSQRDNLAPESAALRSEEKKIRGDEEKDVVDNTSFTVPKEQHSAPKPLRTTTAQPSAPAELKSAFSKCWSTVDDVYITPVTFYSRSDYTPFSIALFRILFTIEEVLDGNEELRWVSPMYFSLPVRVYYAVLFFVQILRAKEASGVISKGDSSFLRAFLRRYPDTSCVIAGPLVPIFTNLVACLPDDKQFDMVSPTLPGSGTYSVSHDGTGDNRRYNLNVSTLHHTLPSIPLVGSMLRLFCTSDDPDSFFENGEFVPVPSTGGDFAGIRFPAKTNGAWNGAYAQVLSNPAIDKPLPESELRLREIHAKWKRSDARFFPNIGTDAPFAPDGMSGLTQLIDNFSWFDICRSMAAIQARFFTDASNVSEIPVLGGRSTLVIGNLTVYDELGRNPIPRPIAVAGWYPNNFSLLKSTFTAFTPTLESDDTWNAVYSLTNMTLNWVDSTNHTIGSREAGHRSGPYWDNQKRTFEATLPREVSTGLHNMVQSLFYTARPNQTKE